MSPQVSLIEGVTELVYSKEIPHGSKIKFEKDETTGKLYFVVEGPSYEWVDLGLSVKWATCNVGATSPEEYGLYFSWGNIDGHAVDEEGNVTDGYSFDYHTYVTTLGGQFTGETLDTEHDAATVNMGEEWRMPTSAETKELVQNTDHYYIGEDGNIVAESDLDGSKLRSICFAKKGETFDYNNRSNFIEIPFAGNCDGSLLSLDGFWCYVWTSSVFENLGKSAINLRVHNGGSILEVGNVSMEYGKPVRGVRK